MGRPTFILMLSALMGFSVLAGRAEESVSFYRDVMPVFAKGSCNSGACHGNANGKGGLKLSLRGENPEQDAKTLTANLPSKRVAPNDPPSSYLLRKPTQQVTHEGGKKFTPESEEYRVVYQWIQQGAINDTAQAPQLTKLDVSPLQQVLEEPHWTVKLQATASFADGSTRDVSRWAVYEPSNLLVTISADGSVTATRHGETTVIVRYLHLQTPVRLAFVPRRPDYAWSNAPSFNFIDDAVFAKLRLLKLNPSPLCDDATFLRRAYFDVLGIPPTKDEAVAFINNPAPTQEKRAKLIDSLLARPEYGEQWALRWSDLLRNEEKVVDKRGVEIFYDWIRDGFNADKPLNEFASELVTGFGSSYTDPPSNYYRTLRDPATRAEATAQVFLGTRLQCAKCHNHPFEKWTQNDYYRFSALFDGVDYMLLGNQRADKFDKHQFSGEQVVHLEGKRDLKDPRTKKRPAPGLLDPTAPAMSLDEGAERFTKLAAWMTSAENPLFARVQVNRIWYHLNGMGIVDPVDDFRATNPPSNPALLDALAAEFVRTGFRVKPLVKSILLSRTYQTSSEPDSTNIEDTANFSHAKVTRRTAEQLLDSIHASLDTKAEFRGINDGRRAGQMAGIKRKTSKGGGAEPTQDDRFLVCFGKPARLISSELERSNATSLAQVFTLTSGPGINALLRSPQNRLHEIRQFSQDDPGKSIDELFWWTLNRPPTSAESGPLVESLKSSPDRRQALEDVAWAMLNSKEFLLRK